MNYTYVLDPFNFQRASKLFQNHTSQLKVKIANEVIKKTSADMEEPSNWSRL